MNIQHNDIAQLDKALSNGGVALVPTETVYGLAACANNQAAIDKIYAIKGRDFNKPLALCVYQKSDYQDLVLWSALAQEIADQFWPGPLTLIMPAADATKLDRRLYGQDAQGQPTLALRCALTQWSPHSQSLPLALTSANHSGAPEITNFDIAYRHFEGQIDAAFKDDSLIGAKNANSAKASTLLSLNGQRGAILRQGYLTKEDFAPFAIDWD